MKTIKLIPLALGAALALSAFASAPADAAPASQRCLRHKLFAAKNYGHCRTIVHVADIVQGRPADFTRCDGKYTQAFAKAENFPDCVLTGDAAAIQAEVVSNVDTLAAAQAGALTRRAKKCAQKKIRFQANYRECRLGAEWRSVRKAAAPNYTPCINSLNSKWTRAEAKFGVDCPTMGDLATVQQDIDDHTDLATCLLNGGGGGCFPTTTTTTTSTTTTTL